jgi:hypothetical protein
MKETQDIIKQKFYLAQKYIETIANKYQYLVNFRINDFVWFAKKYLRIKHASRKLNFLGTSPYKII